MINKSQLTELWDHMRQAHGICLRAFEVIPADQIDRNPIPGMRSPKQLMAHTYGMVIRELCEGTVRGTIREVPDDSVVPQLKTHADVVKFMNDSFEAATKAVNSLTDAQLTSTVKTPWEFEAPGAVMFGILQDEYFHHRGQLYAYVRATGKAPPMVWDFANNAAPWKPKQHASA